jgi:hypothetical protein
MNRQEDIEPQHEGDWLCTVELLPNDDLEGRVFAADIVGWHSLAILRPARTRFFFPYRRLGTKTSS